MTRQIRKTLCAARHKLGYSIRDVERISKNKITQGAVNHIEVGRTVNPHPNTLRVLCDVLNVNYMSVMVAAGYITRRDLKPAKLTTPCDCVWGKRK